MPLGKKHSSLKQGQQVNSRTLYKGGKWPLKRYGFLYEQITSIENCKLAIENAAATKMSRDNVIRIIDNLTFYAVDLSRRLKNFDFITEYHTRIIYDGLQNKKRELNIPSFYPDQCAHHAIVQIIQPIILKSSYYWSCANITKRGISRAVKGVERATKRDRRHAKYCIKMDIRHFYPSIPHDKLKTALRRKFKDRELLHAFDLLIDSYEKEPGKGIPIGNYSSPWFAEFFLQSLDQFILEQPGTRHYIRYADDLVIIGSNKRELHRILDNVCAYVANMGMEIKKNYQLFLIENYNKDKHLRRGRKIDFVGRCFALGATSIRKRCALAIMRQSRQIRKIQKRGEIVSFHTAAGFMSRCAIFKNTNSQAMRNKYYNTLNIGQLKKVLRKASKLSQKKKG